MRRLTALLSLSIVLVLCVKAQDINYSALLLSFEGEGKFVRGGEEADLTVPLSLMAGDMVHVTDGSAQLLLFSGEEVSVVATGSYSVPGVATSASLMELTSSNSKGNGLLGQSGMAYRMRGENNVFPVKSKILNNDNAVIRFTFDEETQTPLNFKLVDSQTQKTVWAKENFTDSTLSLQKVSLDEGKSYYWTVTGLPSGKPVMGVISPSSNKDLQVIEASRDNKSHYDYVESILLFHRYNYYFEAIELVEEAIRKYPDAEVYQKMKENLLLNF